MDALGEDDEEKYKRQFAKYLDDDVSSDILEEIYQKAHEAIRADPAAKPTEKKDSYDTKKHKMAKLTKAERKARVQEKLKKIQEERAAE
jgi:large subunit ribosomal protein L5e